MLPSLVFVIGFILSSSFLYVFVPYLSRGFLAQPNDRSSHRIPTPSGGGLAFVVVTCISSVISILIDEWSVVRSLPLFVAPLAIVGLFDDRFQLPASWRYSVQLLTASFLLAVSPLFYQVVLAFQPFSLFTLSLFCFLLIAITAIINFTNFMDGLDGLVAGCMSLTIGAIAFSLSVPWSIWVLIGSLVGFLFWNWSPARVFMGDVGSTFLGAIFSGMVLQASSWPQAFAYLLLATPLLGDAFTCVIRRLFAGQPIFQAHRLHLFQRLHQAGWSHASVSLAYITATLLLCLVMLTASLFCLFLMSVLVFLVGFCLDRRHAVPFALSP